MFKLFRSKFAVALSLLAMVLAIGVLGFHFIAGYGWTDAMYMTIITISTVGFGEVFPLDPVSKVFAIGLIATNVIVFTYSISVITEYIISRNPVERLKQKKVKKLLQDMNNHVIICGYGRNGRQAAERLKIHKRDFVVIERDSDLIERYENEILFVNGDANQDEVLLEARIGEASAIIMALPKDSANLFSVLTARQLNPKVRIISRASQESTVQKLKFAGADNVVMPDKIGGDHMASLLVSPDLVEFIDNLSVEGENSINLEEVSMAHLPAEYWGKTILELDLRRKTGCNVIGFKPEKGDYVVNPEASTILSEACKIIVLGRPEQIRTLNSLFSIKEPF